MTSCCDEQQIQTKRLLYISCFINSEMSSNAYSKQSYGLLVSNKVANTIQKTKNVFGDDSDSDAGEGSGTTDWMRKKLQTESKKKLKPSKLEDATIYQYDEVYDEMQEKKLKESVKYRNTHIEEKKPKYIASLLKSAEDRERERERRMERKVEKERIAEGDQFKDKESFVTAAYREKMEEMERLQEEERRKEALDDLCEVTKQKDMSGFYRHLYRQTMGEEKGQKEIVKDSKENASTQGIKKIDKTTKKYRAKNVESSEESSSSDEGSSTSEEDDNEKNREKGGSPSRDDSSVMTQSREEKMEEMRTKLKKERERREARKKRIDRGEDSSDDELEEKRIKMSESEKQKTKDAKSSSAATKDTKEKTIPPKPKKDIWKKITCGKTFDDCVQRYFQRKSERTQFPVL